MPRKHGAMSLQRKNRILEKMYQRDAYPVKFASVMYRPEFSFRDLLALPFWVLAGTALWINERLGGRWTRENVYVLESDRHVDHVVKTTSDIAAHARNEEAKFWFETWYSYYIAPEKPMAGEFGKFATERVQMTGYCKDHSIHPEFADWATAILDRNAK